MSHIATELGYASASAFTAMVRRSVGAPPSTYRQEAARATAGMPSCVAKQVTRPVRNREAPAVGARLA